ncbi:MAG TPA: cupin domain-containing protein, partial [Kofleriaceae bacterium]|nr:cupin domain-containing protein [Kofleriaceae bacterium]
QPAAATSHGDPAPHRAPTVIAADKLIWQGKAEATKMAVLWTVGEDVGRLLMLPAKSRGRPSTDLHDRVAIQLDAKPHVELIAMGGPPQDGIECHAAAPCTFYEHTIPRGQQSAGSLAWEPYGPDRQFAPAWGTVETGSFGVFVELKPSTATFWHMHGHDVRMVVLAGTVEYAQSGDPAFTLTPGSYVSQQGGYKHSERCTSASGCVLYIHGDYGFDVRPM